MTAGRRGVAAVGVLAAAVALAACDDTHHFAPVAVAVGTPTASLTVVSTPPPPGGAAAVAAAMRYQLTHCSWDWHTSFAAHLAAETALATPGYARRLRARANPVSWKSEVVGQRQSVTCTVLDARLAPGAPDDAVIAYVRLVVLLHVDSTRGSFDTGELAASCVMRRIGGRWLVDGPFEGG